LTLGLLATLKENFVLLGGVMILGELIFLRSKARAQVNLNASFFKSLGLAFLLAFVWVIVFYTGFFRDPDGLKKFFEAFQFWQKTGTHGNGHEKPLDYWVRIFLRYEWLAFVGVFPSLILLFKKGESGLRFLSWISVGTLAVYSGIAYKTPWCLMSFYWGLVLVGAAWIEGGIGKRKWGQGLVVGALVWSAYQSYDLAIREPDQDGHPYIYGQTYHELTDAVQEVIREIHSRGTEKTVKIQVVSGFTWPLPYLLGGLPVAYHGDANLPSELQGDYVFIDQKLLENFPKIKNGSAASQVVRSRQWASPMVILRKP
jgi:hypothetical protein